MRRIFLACIGFTYFYCVQALSQAGSLDTAFGNGDGLVSTSYFNEHHAKGYAIAVQADGHILVAGYTRTPAGLEQAVINRYAPDGTLDPTFNGNGKIILETPGPYVSARAVAVQPDGRIIAVTLRDSGTESFIYLYRLLTDGSPDMSFDEDGVVITSLSARKISTKALALLPDGRIMVGGYIGQSGEDFNQFLILRYLADGSVDNGFGDNGALVTRVGDGYTNVSSILLQPDGKCIAAGYAQVDEKDVFAAVRYHPNGDLDFSFGIEGISLASMSDGDNRGIGAALQPDGKIIIGGYAYSPVTGKNVFAAIRLLSNGQPDPGFHGDGMNSFTVSGEADGVRCMLLQPDGKILLGGYAHSNVPGGADMTLVRLLSNGLADPTFDGDGIAVYEDGLEISSEVHSLDFQPDGKLVGCGFVRKDGTNAIRVARFITGLTVSSHELDIPDLETSVYPNPARQEIQLSYTLDLADDIQIHLYDMQGVRIKTVLPATARPAGKNRETLILPEVPAGNYMLMLQLRQQQTTVPVRINMY